MEHLDATGVAPLLDWWCGSTLDWSCWSQRGRGEVTLDGGGTVERGNDFLLAFHRGKKKKERVARLGPVQGRCGVM